MRKTSILLIMIFLIFYQPAAGKAADAPNTEKKNIESIRIGTENRRQPYTYLDSERRYSGILVEHVKKICETEKIACDFTSNDFYGLLGDLQDYRLNTMIVVDSLVLPEIDNVILSKPLCNISSVFIQKNTGSVKTEKEDFQRSTIGVLKGSLHHFYLLDEYSSLARLKSYELLESGVVDLVFGRIDALFADEAFFNVRIQSTSLGGEDKANRFVAVKVGQSELSPTAMRLAVRDNDAELLAVLDKNIPDNPPLCVDLIEKTENIDELNSDTTKRETLK